MTGKRYSSNSSILNELKEYKVDCYNYKYEFPLR